MEDEALRNTLEECFTAYINDEEVNIVDGLFAIADSISALEKTIGSEPTIDMNKDLCRALESIGGAEGGLEISNSLDRVAKAIEEHGNNDHPEPEK
jgi:hypothetical protein